MADNVTLPGTGAAVASDDVGGVQYQRVKLTLGADNAADMDVDSGQQAMANSVPVAIASDQSSIPVDTELTTADLDTGAGTDTRAVVGLVGSKSGGGEIIPGSAADGLLVNLGANNDVVAAGDVAHDAADSGNPVKIGAKAQNVVPADVSNNDRADLHSDLRGRLLVCHVPAEAQVWKSFNTTSIATGSTIWDPTSGKRIAITHIIIGTYGSTAARVILWFGANGDTTYNEGTDQPVFKGSFAPSSTGYPGAIIVPPTGIYCLTADHELHITTDAGISIDVTVYGYEF